MKKAKHLKFRGIVTYTFQLPTWK